MPLSRLDGTYKYCIILLPMPFLRKIPAIINHRFLFFDLHLLFKILWLLTICFLHMSREIYVILEQNYIHLTPRPQPSKLNYGTHVYFLSVTLNFVLTDSATAAVPRPAIEFRYYQPFSVFSRTNLSFTCNWTIRTWDTRLFDLLQILALL